MIASLPMYDRPETRAANDALWAGVCDRLRAAGLAAPPALSRGGPFGAEWTDPHLVLSQTCGLPYRLRLHGRVQLVGAPVLDVPARGVPPLPPGRYCSVMVARHDDPRQSLPEFEGARLAYNAPDSQSGWAAPMGHAQAEGVRFGAFLRTGGHRASAQAVAEGRADITGIDCLSWALIDRLDPFAAGLRVIGATRPTPALPYICAPGIEAACVAEALSGAIAALDADSRGLLGLAGLVAVSAADYLRLPAPPLAPTA